MIWIETGEEPQPGPFRGHARHAHDSERTVDLALGPSRFMVQKKYVLTAGDQIDVIGANTQVDGHDLLIVRPSCMSWPSMLTEEGWSAPTSGCGSSN